MTFESNLSVWNAGEKVPKEATSPFNNGRFSGTDINRMWRVHVLTKLFGPAGIGWDWKIVDVQTFKLDADDRVVIFARGELRIMDPSTKMWSQPITGFGGNDLVQSKSKGVRINDEAYKMVDTDAFGHACSKLGIGASVYWNEVTKYTAEKAEDEPNQGFIPKADKTPAQAPAQSKKQSVPTATTSDRKAAENDAKTKSEKMQITAAMRFKCLVHPEYMKMAEDTLKEHGCTEELTDKNFDSLLVKILEKDDLQDLQKRIDELDSKVVS